MVRVATRTTALLALALALGGVVAAAGGPGTAQTTESLTFDCTGSAQQWVVPAGVTQATVEAFGAEGGVGDDGQLEEPSSAAGLGGSFTATIAVTPGETIQVNVGCQGESSSALGVSPAGGFGGSPGGDGGAGGDLGNGGGGGGSSDVRQGGTALTNRVVVAGGGGGSGGANSATTTNGEGGNGGGTDGVGGVNSATAGGGEGGTATTNGAGGQILVTCTGATGVPGDAGTDAQGGDAQDDPTFGAGGGGGGGFHGGGGGAGCVGGGGGGGGSGFAVASATGVSQAVGVQTGDGQVVITFTPEPAPAPAPAAPVAAQPTFTG